MKKERTLKMNKNFMPCEVYENEEYYPNGVFVFNITRIIEHIQSGQLVVEQEDISVSDCYKTQVASIVVSEEHLKTVTLETPIILVEISPGRFNVIDGNHRLERAYRDQIKTIKSFKLKAEQLIPYFRDVEGYRAFVTYWNDKLTDL